MIETAPVDARAEEIVAATGWSASLALRVERQGPRSVLTSRRHVGPLRVQKPLYPEGDGVCQVIVVHPPGGIVAGDSLAIEIDAFERAHVQATTPGAAKWYRSSGRAANAETTLRAGHGALIEWLPQETILFDGARASTRIVIELEGDARFIGWDVICLGRTASGEAFDTGSLRQRFDLFRDGELRWCDRGVFDGGSRALQSGAILGGAPVFGTMIAAAGAYADGVVSACRDVRCPSGNAAITRLPDALVARYRGDSSDAARTYFATLWRVLRPAIAGRDAVLPRIWNT